MLYVVLNIKFRLNCVLFFNNENFSRIYFLIFENYIVIIQRNKSTCDGHNNVRVLLWSAGVLNIDKRIQITVRKLIDLIN